MDIHTLASGSDGNSYIVERDGPALLIEAGLPFSELERRVWRHDYSLASLAGCLISHAHADHCQATEGLIERGLPVYMGIETAEFLGLGCAVGDELLKSKNERSVGKFRVTAYPLVHGGVENFGFLIKTPGESLFYATDTPHIPYAFKNLDYLMVECNYIESRLDDAVYSGQAATAHATKSIKTHLSLDSLLEYLGHLDTKTLKEIHLLHVSGEFAEAQKCKRRVQGETGVVTKLADRG